MVENFPPKLAKALVDAIKSAKKLGKDEQNKFGNYRYVTIDKYLEHIPSMAAEHGIAWSPPHEIAFEFHDGPKPMLITTYEWDLFHESGEAVHRFARLSVVHPIQGPQTAGSSLAYAEKMFQRYLLKVPTGETEDADSLDPNALDTQDHEPAQLPETEKISFDDLEVIPEKPSPNGDSMPSSRPSQETQETSDGLNTLFWSVMTAIDMCKTEDHLIQLWEENQEPMNILMREAPDKFNDVRSTLEKRRTEILGA